jgi:glycosyltransferase involved in cell wall biosynthesis
MDPRVSVIVPVHNVADTLERCVRSLLEQTLSDVEVVLVDDGSSDGSGDLCDAFALADRRVVVAHQENGGVSDARNAGLAIARGELIGFLDGDDWIEPNALAEMAEVAQATGADVVMAGCFVDVVDEVGHRLSSRTVLPDSALLGPVSPPLRITEAFVNLIGYVWNKLYSRELLHRGAVEFPKEISFGEDMIFNADVLTSTSSVAVIDRAFVHYVQRPRTTLGTAFRLDFLGLRLRAIGGVRAVLEHWAVEGGVVDGVVAEMQVMALRGVVSTTSGRPGFSLRQQAAHLRGARPGIDGLIETRALSMGRRLQLWTLRNAPASALVAASRVRARKRLGVSPTGEGPA